jgi:hypothetical protein
MRKVIALVSSLLLVVTFATPAQSAGAKYSVYQKTLATFISSATTLSTQQKAQVKATVEANPTAEKFICTGIRYYDQPMSVNITVRKRAKAACEYAKQLNPALSTWFQNKPTKARSYAGKVLLTVKSSLGETTAVTPKASYDYAACDTSAKQPLTKVDIAARLVYSYSCPTDRTKPTDAAEAVIRGTALEPCMVEDKSLEGNDPNGYGYITGFPRNMNAWSNETKKVILVAFDWPDIKDPGKPLDYLSNDVRMFQDYMEVYTRGHVKFDVYIHPERITLLEPSSKFSQSEAQQNTSQWGGENVNAVDFFYAEAIRASDPVIDFTDNDMVLFVPPRGSKVFAEFNLWPPLSKSYETNEDPIVRAFTPGGDFHFRPENNLWFFWAHESMHYFKLPDLYWHDQNSVKRTENTFAGAFKDYDIMDGRFTTTLNSYLMWLAEWTLPGEQECLTTSNFKESSFELFPVGNNDDSLKSVMLRLSDTELIVVESRRYTKFDRLGNRTKEGVLVYYVNSTIGNGEGALTIIAPQGRTVIWDDLFDGAGTEMLDAFLYEGNYIEIAGYRIEVNKAYQGSDIVSIRPDVTWSPGDTADYVCMTIDNRQLDDPSRVDCPIVF